MACARIKKYQRTTISPSTARIAKKPICRIALERQALFIYCFTPMMYRSPSAAVQHKPPGRIVIPCAYDYFVCDADSFFCVFVILLLQNYAGRRLLHLLRMLIGPVRNQRRSRVQQPKYPHHQIPIDGLSVHTPHTHAVARAKKRNLLRCLRDVIGQRPR